jgi:hypothetical protein
MKPTVLNWRHPANLNLDSHASVASSCVLCGPVGLWSWCLPDKVELTPHQWNGNFDAVCREIIDARVWGGIHFRQTDEDSSALGRQIGDYAVQTWLRPVSGTPAAARPLPVAQAWGAGAVPGTWVWPGYDHRPA